MEKYVSFRIEKTDTSRVMAAVNHDRRFGYQPSYINSELSDENITLIGETFSKEQLHEKMKIQDDLVKEKTNRGIQKNAERFTAGIMTFSNTMKEDQKNNPELFKKCSKEFLERLEKYKFQIEYAEIHLDETTPHIHILFDNISRETGKSIRRKINPKILVEIQSLMGKCFEPMGYQRGIDSKITNARNISVSGYKDLEDTKKQLSDDNNTLIKLFNDLMNTKPLTEEQKDLLSDLAPSLFQFIDKDDRKKKAALSEKISKALRM